MRLPTRQAAVALLPKPGQTQSEQVPGGAKTLRAARSAETQAEQDPSGARPRRTAKTQPGKIDLPGWRSATATPTASSARGAALCSQDATAGRLRHACRGHTLLPRCDCRGGQGRLLLAVLPAPMRLPGRSGLLAILSSAHATAGMLRARQGACCPTFRPRSPSLASPSRHSLTG